jgi:hypothetical protein
LTESLIHPGFDGAWFQEPFAFSEEEDMPSSYPAETRGQVVETLPALGHAIELEHGAIIELAENLLGEPVYTPEERQRPLSSRRTPRECRLARQTVAWRADCHASEPNQDEPVGR